MHAPRLILASASPRRLSLLAQIGVIPDIIDPAEIVETSKTAETPRTLALRLSQAKVEAVCSRHPGDLVIGADTVVACGRRLLAKAPDAETARDYLSQLSGRRHHVVTAVVVADAEGGVRSRVVDTIVAFKRLSVAEIEHYLTSGEWENKAGAYAIQGLAGAFVRYMRGSYSNVVGLPLYETVNLLRASGYTCLGSL